MVLSLTPFPHAGRHKAAADRANDAVRAATSPPAHAAAALAVGRAALARGDARAAAAALRDALNDTALPADLRPGAQRDRDAAEATAAVAVTAPPGAPVPWYAPPPAETADPADDEAIQRAQAALWSKKDARKAAGILRRAVSGARSAPETARRRIPAAFRASFLLQRAACALWMASSSAGSAVSALSLIHI